jgi:hypothetical protein
MSIKLSKRYRLRKALGLDSPKAVVREAYRILKDYSNWTRGVSARNANGDIIDASWPAWREHVDSVCLLGSFTFIGGKHQNDAYWLVTNKATRAGYRGGLAIVNDFGGYDAVIKLLERTR